MAALLSVFHPVPPVIRRRAKELLDTIRDAVKAALGAPTAAMASLSVLDVQAEEAPAAMVVDATETVKEVADVSITQPSPPLWASGKRLSYLLWFDMTQYASSGLHNGPSVDTFRSISPQSLL